MDCAIFNNFKREYEEKWLDFVLNDVTIRVETNKMKTICMNPNFNMDMILTYHHKKQLSYECLAHNPNLTPDFILNNAELFPKHYWKFLAINPNVTMQFIEEHPNLPWNIDLIYLNPNLTTEFAKKILNKINAQLILTNSKFAIDKIPEKYNEHKRKCMLRRMCEWIFDKFYDSSHNNRLICNAISYNPHLTIDVILLVNCTEYLNWNEISKNKNITMEIIEEYSNNLPHLSNKPNLPWNYWFVSQNPNLTVEFVLNRPTYSWNYREIFRNPNFCFNYNFRKIIYGYHTILLELTPSHPCLTIDYIKQKNDKSWHCGEILNHDFSYDKQSYIEMSIVKLLLITLMEYHMENYKGELAEKIIANDYLIRQMIKYSIFT